MHYKNGREAKSGDPVVGKNYNSFFAGVLHSLNAGCTTCNAQVAIPVIGGSTNWCVTVGELYHAEDAFKAVDAPFNTPPQPPVSNEFVAEGCEKFPTPTV